MNVVVKIFGTMILMMYMEKILFVIQKIELIVTPLWILQEIIILILLMSLVNVFLVEMTVRLILLNLVMLVMKNVPNSL